MCYHGLAEALRIADRSDVALAPTIPVAPLATPNNVHLALPEPVVAIAAMAVRHLLDAYSPPI